MEEWKNNAVPWVLSKLDKPKIWLMVRIKHRDSNWKNAFLVCDCCSFQLTIGSLHEEFSNTLDNRQRRHMDDLQVTFPRLNYQVLEVRLQRSFCCDALMTKIYPECDFLRNLGFIGTTALHRRSQWQRALLIETGSFCQSQPIIYRFPRSMTIQILYRFVFPALTLC